MGWLGIPGGVYESRKRDVQTGGATGALESRRPCRHFFSG
jgi:hypothetical protein